MIRSILLFNRQGKIRLCKLYDTWNIATTEREKQKAIREMITIVLKRKICMSNFIEWKDYIIVYKRYASLFFIFVVDRTDNELIVLDLLHRYVEILDCYFGAVCELDIIYNFEKAHFLLNEMILGGEVQETSKLAIIRYTQIADHVQEQECLSIAMSDTASI